MSYWRDNEREDGMLRMACCEIADGGKVYTMRHSAVIMEVGKPLSIPQQQRGRTSRQRHHLGPE
jgi:hypothetical protein